VKDIESGEILFKKGFDCIFKEYQTTQPAIDGEKKTYHESAIIPFPKNKIVLSIKKRNKKNEFDSICSLTIDPQDYHIIHETNSRNDSINYDFADGDSHNKLDIAFIGEAYTNQQFELFKQDFESFTNYFFDWEPYKSNKEKINIYGICPFSKEPGIDEPRKGIYKSTVLQSTFNYFDSPRYILIEDNKTLRDIASQVPYDVIVVLVNTERYGGGGILNQFAIYTKDENWEEQLFHHEFGHSFAGLADEYYTSGVSYEDFYPIGIEPVEPNISRLLDPENCKWKDLLSEDTEIPTPWGKEKFDSLNVQKSDYYKSLSVSDLTEDEKIEINKQIRMIDKEIKKFLIHHPLSGKPGVYEGAGYSTKGIYRASINSIMHNFNKNDRFCPVSQKAIENVIKYYSE